MFYVYVLRSSKDKRLYTGYTNNIVARLIRHNTGKVKSTRFRQPLQLIYYETYPSKDEARKREVYLKSWAGRIWLLNKLGKIRWL